MTQLDRCFEAAKSVVKRDFGGFDNEPDGYELESGLLRDGKAGFTESTVPLDGSEDVKPRRIVIDKDLAENDPESACNTVAHEALEYRMAELMTIDELRDGKTHIVAESAEDVVCRRINEDTGEQICNESLGK